MTAPRRILVSCSAPPDKGSGILAYAKELSLALLARGHEVHFMSPTPGDHGWLAQHGIAHLPTDKLTDQVQSAGRALSYIRQNRIDLAINNDNPVLQSLAPALPCPLIVVGHLNATAIAALACHQPQWTDHIVAISNDMLACFLARTGVSPRRCALVLNGIAAEAPPGDDPPPSVAGSLRALFLGGWDRRKGSDLLLDALGHREAWRGISLDWYGDLPADRAGQIARNGQVRIMGRAPHAELLRRLPGYDVLLFPSRAEGCPMAMLEAMRAGVVSITTDGTGAMKDMIDHGREGYVCSLANWPRQMLECAAHLRDTPHQRAHMRQAVRQRFQGEFTADRVAERLLELGSLPTVDRRNPPRVLSILIWHRISNADAGGLNLTNRICTRLGILRRAGELRLAQQDTHNQE